MSRTIDFDDKPRLPAGKIGNIGAYRLADEFESAQLPIAQFGPKP
jgi:hypothetical protein